MKCKAVLTLALSVLLIFATACAKSPANDAAKSTAGAGTATASPYANFKTALMLPALREKTPYSK